MPQDDADKEKQRRGNVVRKIVYSAATVWIPLGAATLAATKSIRSTEDILGLTHAVVATASAARLVAKSKDTRYAQQVKFKTMPQRETKNADWFLQLSTGFFVADAVHIAIQVLVRKNYALHQWKERLAHHALQAVANVPTILTSPSTVTGVATRSYLSQAYLAEASEIFLRAHNILCTLGWDKTRAWVVKTNYKVLLVVFALCRLVNFGLCYKKLKDAANVMPKYLVKAHSTGTAAAYALSTVWFLKLFGKWRRQIRKL